MNSQGEVASLHAYRRALSRTAPLSREDERALARRWMDGDARAGERLALACLPFVVSIAVEYRRWGVPLEDIVQEGNVGLLRALRKYDPDKECRLVTYAAYWIRAAIREYVVRAYRIVRLGTTKHERRALRLYRTTRESDPERLAKASGLSLERIERLLPLLATRETSLDANTNASAAVVERVVARDRSPEEEASMNEARTRAHDAIRDALEALNERERIIVEERILADEPTTLQELGLRLGVSKERVRQLEERAYGKLRSSLYEMREVAYAG